MRPTDFPNLDVARFRLRLRALQDAALPAFLGSTLRGAFGHSLKQAVCVMPHRACERCLVRDRCLYPYLFETPPPVESALLSAQHQAPRPFILTPATTLPRSSADSGRAPRRLLAAGETLSFDLTVMGRAIDYLPYIVFAVTEMADRGLGVGRSRFEMDDVEVLAPDGNERSIYRGRTGRLATPPDSRTTLADLVESRPRAFSSSLAASSVGTHHSSLDLHSSPAFHSSLDFRSSLAFHSALSTHHSSLGLHPSLVPNLALITHSSSLGSDSSLITHHSSLKLSFLTPTRIRMDGAAQLTLPFEVLVRSLLRRISMLCSVHGRSDFQMDFRGLIDRAASVAIVRSDLQWADFERYSNRQGRKMNLGGFVGEIEYEGSGLAEFLPLIAAGEFMHVGSNTTFGLGLYKIEWEPRPGRLV
jgi:hypothetical protein